MHPQLDLLPPARSARQRQPPPQDAPRAGVSISVTHSHFPGPRLRKDTSAGANGPEGKVTYADLGGGRGRGSALAVPRCWGAGRPTALSYSPRRGHLPPATARGTLALGLLRRERAGTSCLEKAVPESLWDRETNTCPGDAGPRAPGEVGVLVLGSDGDRGEAQDVQGTVQAVASCGEARGSPANPRGRGGQRIVVGRP